MTYRNTGTAYKLARQKRHLKWLADNGPVYDPDKYPVPLGEMEEAGPVLDYEDSSSINSGIKDKQQPMPIIYKRLRTNTGLTATAFKCLYLQIQELYS